MISGHPTTRPRRMTSLMTAVAFRSERRPRTLPAHKRDETSMVANSQQVWLFLPMNVQSSSACSSLMSKSRSIRSLKRFAAVEARSSQRAMVLREWPVTLAVAERLTPSTRRLASCSNSRRVQRRPLYAVPVFVLSVPLQTVHRYRCRRPDLVANEPWPTMLRPGFPRLSHPGVAHAIPSIAFIAQVYGGAGPVLSSTTSEVMTDQQRPAQAPGHRPPCRVLCTTTLRSRAGHSILSRRMWSGWLPLASVS